MFFLFQGLTLDSFCDHINYRPVSSSIGECDVLEVSVIGDRSFLTLQAYVQLEVQSSDWQSLDGSKLKVCMCRQSCGEHV